MISEVDCSVDRNQHPYFSVFDEEGRLAGGAEYGALDDQCLSFASRQGDSVLAITESEVNPTAGFTTVLCADADRPGRPMDHLLVLGGSQMAACAF